MPKITALLINYNYGHFLRDALESIRAQTFKDYELVVADDGSTDDSASILREYSDIVTEVVTGEHVGLPRNLGRATSWCDGELLAFLSADDRWLPDHLAVGVAALDRHAEAALSYSSWRLMDETGSPLETTPTRKRPQTPSGWISPYDLLPGQFIHTQTLLLRRAIFDEVGGFDEELVFTELDLLLRVVARYPVIALDQTTVEYRVHGSSMGHNHELTLSARLALYDKHLVGTPPRLKKRMIAEAYWKTAYKELIGTATPENIAPARRHVWRAIMVCPRSAFTRLNLLILAVAIAGRVFAGIYARYGKRFSRSRFKLLLQAVVGIGSPKRRVVAASQGMNTPAEDHYPTVAEPPAETNRDAV